MKSLLLTTLAILGLAASTHADNPIASADALLAKKFPADEPGAVVHVLRNGQTLLLQGYGLADLDKKTPLTADSAFDLASVSKQFTAMAIMLLAERGRLGYDDNLRRWLPEMPEFEKPITLRNLLNQTSGLPDYLNLFKGSDDEFARLTNADLPAMFKNVKPRFAPGEKFEYSNTNYALLPLIVERASGVSFSRFMERNVFAPAGMKSTLVMDSVPVAIANRAGGYSRKIFSKKYDFARRDGPVCGDGNVFTTVRDLAKWDTALREALLVRHDTLDAAWSSVKLTDGKSSVYGFGWMIVEKNGKKMIWHNGGWAGTSTFIGRWLDDGLTVILLSNHEGTNAMGVAKDVAALFRAKSTGDR